MKPTKKNDDFYILNNPLNKTIKIGRSVSVKSRIRNLVTQSGIPEIEIVAIFKEKGDYEKYFKYLFKEYNHIGEWYKKEHDIIGFFEYILCIDYEFIQYDFDDLIIRLAILINDLPQYIDEILIYDNLVEMTDNLLHSATEIYNKIKLERKGIGYGVQTSFLDFIVYKKMLFRNVTYQLKMKNKNKYEVIKILKSSIEKKHVAIEVLKMKLNTETDNNEKIALQKTIDDLYKMK